MGRSVVTMSEVQQYLQLYTHVEGPMHNGSRRGSMLVESSGQNQGMADWNDSDTSFNSHTGQGADSTDVETPHAQIS